MHGTQTVCTASRKRHSIAIRAQFLRSAGFCFRLNHLSRFAELHPQASPHILWTARKASCRHRKFPPQKPLCCLDSSAPKCRPPGNHTPSAFCFISAQRWLSSTHQPLSPLSPNSSTGFSTHSVNCAHAAPLSDQINRAFHLDRAPHACREDPHPWPISVMLTF